MGNYVVIGEDDFAEKLAKRLQTDFIQVKSTIVIFKRKIGDLALNSED